MGDRHLDTRIIRIPKIDKEAGQYPDMSPYSYVNNSFTNAIDPDGRLIVFVNGYRPAMPVANMVREVFRNDRMTYQDVHSYWGVMDDRFMARIGDYNKIYADGDAPTFTASNQTGFNKRVEHGRAAGIDLISRINSGEVVLAKNDAGQVTESIKIVTHSMGYAYGLGISQVLLEAGYKIEVSYNLAPEHDRAGNIPGGVVRSVQYGVHPNEAWDRQDRIAGQSSEGIGNVDERAYIPENSPMGPVASHVLENYGWVFDKSKEQRGYVAPSENNAPKKSWPNSGATIQIPKQVNAKDNE